MGDYLWYIVFGWSVFQGDNCVNLMIQSLGNLFRTLEKKTPEVISRKQKYDYSLLSVSCNIYLVSGNAKENKQ